MENIEKMLADVNAVVAGTASANSVRVPAASASAAATATTASSSAGAAATLAATDLDALVDDLP
jgi:hypothetical protein